MLLQFRSTSLNLLIDLSLLFVVSELLKYYLLSLNITIFEYPPDRSSGDLGARKHLLNLLCPLMQCQSNHGMKSFRIWHIIDCLNLNLRFTNIFALQLFRFGSCLNKLICIWRTYMFKIISQLLMDVCLAKTSYLTNLSQR